MKNRWIVILIVIGGLLSGGCVKSASQDSGSAPRVGIYDSRSVVIAFVGSEVYQKTDGLVLKNWMKEYAAAQKRKDQAAIKALKALGEQRQEKRHQQGFGTAPVDDVLEHISAPLDDLRHRHHLDALISKWDQAGLRAYRGARQIDVTEELIELFGPTEKQRQSALEIRSTPPLKGGLGKLH